MKASNHFKNTIKTYLDQRAETDVLFSFQYSKPTKNLDDCVTYILNWVKASGCTGFTDDEIFGQAVHFWDEDSIEIGEPIDCQVIVNHTVILTEEEKEQARQDAIQRAMSEAYSKMRQPKRAVAKAITASNSPSLFDF